MNITLILPLSFSLSNKCLLPLLNSTQYILISIFSCVKQLLEDPESYLNDLLGSGKMLSKKGRMCVYLNNMIFNVTKGMIIVSFLMFVYYSSVLYIMFARAKLIQITIRD